MPHAPTNTGGGGGAATTAAAVAAANRQQHAEQQQQPEQKQADVPLIIEDPSHKKRYHRGRFMGRGGFARCYEVFDASSGAAYACKIVAKSILQKQHHRDKMQQEIQIHRSLSHPHVVQFHAYFEDRLFIYIILELCTNRSLMEMQKRRKQLTEPEARYFARHIIEACRYLHAKHIVHRDLKLGNLFLSDAMEIKLGDFGLAATMDHGDQRRNTLCGTPNYIAPEILDRKGHGFEADVWSLGCILYTLLIGRPPFETSNLKATYEKIKNCDYTIPARTSKQATELIRACLSSKPQDRPTISELLNMEFFHSQYFTPPALPTSCLTMQPRFNDHTVQATAAVAAAASTDGARARTMPAAIAPQNMAATAAGQQRQQDLVGQQQQQRIARPAAAAQANGPIASAAAAASSATSSQHQPLHVANKHTIKTVASSAAVAPISGAGLASTESGAVRGASQAKPLPGTIYQSNLLAAPNMPLTTTAVGAADDLSNNNNKNSSKNKRLAVEKPAAAEANNNNNATVPADYWLSSLRELLQRVCQATADVVDVRDAARCYDAAEDPALAPMIWISKWVDYSDKYGLGYQLIDNSVGVLFNDATKLLLLEDGDQMQYVDRNGKETYIDVAKIDELSTDAKKKVTLLNYFHNYMRDNLLRAGDDLLPTKATNRMARLPWMRAWFRSHNAINMHLTNGTLQINFLQNHQKMILCPLMQAVTIISSNKNNETVGSLAGTTGSVTNSSAAATSNMSVPASSATMTSSPAAELHTYSLEKFVEIEAMPAALRKQLNYAVHICSKLLNNRASGSCRLRVPENSETMLMTQQQQAGDQQQQPQQSTGLVPRRRDATTTNSTTGVEPTMMSGAVGENNNNVGKSHKIARVGGGAGVNGAAMDTA